MMDDKFKPQNIVDCRFRQLYIVKRRFFIFKKIYRVSIQVCLHTDGSFSVYDYFNPDKLKNYEKVFKKDIDDMINEIKQSQSRTHVKIITKSQKKPVTFDEYMFQKIKEINPEVPILPPKFYKDDMTLRMDETRNYRKKK